MKAGPLATLLLSPLLSAGISAAAEAKPNILFILADDLGWAALSCYGNRDVSTPNLDRLASQGLRFTQAYADSQCSPTRAALLSGQYGARTGLFKVIGEKEPPRAFMRPPQACLALSPEVASLAETLRKAGYATGLSGKWHVAHSPFVATLKTRDGDAYFNRYGFDYCGSASAAEHHEDKAVTAITDDIIGFVESNRGKPWFAFAAHFTPHAPLEAPRALVDKHAARGYKRASNPGGTFTERPTAEYLAMLEHLDDEVGRLLRRLDELQLTERTVVVFYSDNGGLSRVTGNGALREGKGSPYEGGVRVPLIVRWPGQVKPGTLCEVPVHAVDFYPTFAALAGGAPPATHRLDGESLLPLWLQQQALKRTALYWHMPTYTTSYGRTPCSVMRQGDWKLVHWFGDSLDTRGFTPDNKPYGKLVVGSRTELYNLRDDIGEARDLAAENPEMARQLKAALEVWWTETGAVLPERNPAYDPDAWSAETASASEKKRRPAKRREVVRPATRE